MCSTRLESEMQTDHPNSWKVKAPSCYERRVCRVVDNCLGGHKVKKEKTEQGRKRSGPRTEAVVGII